MRFHFRASIKPILKNGIFSIVLAPFYTLKEAKISNQFPVMKTLTEIFKFFLLFLYKKGTKKNTQGKVFERIALWQHALMNSIYEGLENWNSYKIKVLPICLLWQPSHFIWQMLKATFSLFETWIHSSFGWLTGMKDVKVSRRTVFAWLCTWVFFSKVPGLRKIYGGLWLEHDLGKT